MDLIIISLKSNVFSPRYGRKIALTPLPSVIMFFGKTAIIENEPQRHHVALVNVVKYTTRLRTVHIRGVGG